MKGKAIALMTALAFVFGLSACGDKTASQAEISDTTREEEVTEVITDKAKVTTEKKEVTEEEEPAPEMTQDEKVQAALGEMPYYGDTANCKMTAEQATAYAQLIADGLAGDFSFREEYSEDYDILAWCEPFYATNPVSWESMLIDASGVILADFAGDGIPYLYLYNNKENYWEDYFEIYGWKDDRAELTFEKSIDSNTLYYLYEEEQGRINLAEESPLSMSHYITRYSFRNGAMEPIYTYSEEVLEDGNTHIMENDVETAVYTPEEYIQYSTPFLGDYVENHNHTQPYTCLYDMTPCTLEEMVDYLNAYASVMSDGRSVPVEIRKADIVRHDGMGIITIGEVPQEKVCKLEILRRFMSGETGIASVNDGAFVYTLTENGSTREISEAEFHSIWNEWESRHTDFSADTHLDILNIENVFQVKIDIQKSGEWLVTSAE